MSKQNNSNKLDAENVTYENLVKSFEDKFHLPIYRANSYPFVPSNMVGKYLIAEEWERVFKESDRNRHHEALNSICRMAIGRELTEQDKSYSVIAEIFKKVGGAVNTEELWKEAHSLLDKISKLIEFEDSDRQKDNISKWIFGLKNIIDLSHSIFEKSNSSNGIQSISPENAVDSDPVFKIFYGPPGTGKTMAARKKVGNSIEKYKIVQVHPSSSYEDMIEGIKPVTFANGDVKYEVQDGPIKIMSKKASNSWVKSIACARFFQDEGDEFILINFPIGTVSKWFSMGEKYCCRIYGESVYKPIITNETVKSDTFKIDIKNSEDKTFWRKLGFSLNQKSKIEERFLQLEFKGNNWGADDYVIVLDELNRGNVASILGELVFAISEARGTHSASERKAVTLQYSHEEFVWPRNLHLYGTMNSTDVSLDRIDQAIKRRFDFETIEPDPSILIIRDLGKNGLNLYLNELNSVLKEFAPNYGAYNIKDKLVGHAIFLPLMKFIEKNLNESNFEILVGNEFKKLWDNQISQSILSILNGSRDELEKFISKELMKFAPKEDSVGRNGTIYGWVYEGSNKKSDESKTPNAVNF